MLEMLAMRSKLKPTGSQVQFTASDTTWTVPDGVTEIHAVAVGQGGSPQTVGSRGGKGGDLRWRNYISVTPGEQLRIINNSDGVQIRRPSNGSTLLTARSGNATSNFTSSPISLPDIGGGNGGVPPVNGWHGGGAGGYSGDGGSGEGTAADGSGPGDGKGGGGGSGGKYTFTSTQGTNTFGKGGGGVGLKGEGASGRGGTGTNSTSPTGGSNGAGTTVVTGGQFGGGGGTGMLSTSGSPGDGGARIIWGQARKFPNTNTGDITA